MKMKYRFTVLALLCLAFLFVAPVMILRTLGFVYDKESRSLIKTGSILANSSPRGAEIILNGKSTGQTTPDTIGFVNPGEYDVSLQKSGYREWSKHFTLAGARVVSLKPGNEPITLFLEQPMQTIISTSTLALLPGANSIIALESTTTVAVLNLQTGERKFTDLKISAATKPVCTRTDAVIFCQIGKLWYAIALSTGHSQLVTVHGMHPSKFVLFAKDTIAFLQDDNVYTYRLTDGKTIKLQTGARDLVGNEDGLTVLTETSVLNFTLDQAMPHVIASDLPPADKGSLISGDSDHLFAILDGGLYSILPYVRRVADSSEYAEWYPQSNSVGFGNSNSFGIWVPEDGTAAAILLRSSALIGPAKFSHVAGYAIYQEGQELKVIETFQTSQRQIFSLIKSDQMINSFATDSELKTIWYLQKNGTLIKAVIR